LQKVKSASARSKLLNGTRQEFQLGGTTFPCIHLAHPGITMRPSSAHNKWADKNAEHCKIACEILDDLLERKKL
jgi:hypothetical protein